MMVHTTNPDARFVCAVCRQRVDELRFLTSRLSICADCVRLLNTTELSAREAKAKWKAEWKKVLRRTRGQEVDGWKDSWFDEKLRQRLKDPKLLARIDELKVLRAYQLRLVCLDRRYLGYPSNWSFKSLRTKSEDGLKCAICGVGGADEELHVHHIVFRSRSGTNSARNLVTLCFRHHQEQHDHPISRRGGEAPGPDIDVSDDDVSPSTSIEVDLDIDFEVEEAAQRVVPKSVPVGSEAQAARASDSTPATLGSEGHVSKSTTFTTSIRQAPVPTAASPHAAPAPVRIDVPVSTARAVPAPRPPRGVHVPPVGGATRSDRLVEMWWFWVAATLFGALILLVSIEGNDRSATDVSTVIVTPDVTPQTPPKPVVSSPALTEEEKARAAYAAEYARLVKRHPELLTDTRLADEVADERDRLMAQGLSGHAALRIAAERVLGQRERPHQ